MKHAVVAFNAIAIREFRRFLSQRGRFLSALVRPLVWLVVFAAGFRATLGISIIPPYQTYISYETYILPGLCGMILLFSCMQSSLSLVYDREMGSMRLLLTAPIHRAWLLFFKLVAGVLVGMLQVYAFLFVAWTVGVVLPLAGYVLIIPALFVSGLMLGSLGLLLASLVRLLENFATIMNFVIFPMFFLSSALYPLWRMKESSEYIYNMCVLNPFSYAVEFIRFSGHSSFETSQLVIVLSSAIFFFALAIYFYAPDGRFRTCKDADLFGKSSRTDGKLR